MDNLGGLPYELTEGDILCVFSQYGEIVNIHLVRDSKTGESKGYCFLAYVDQRSTILAVDNLNAIKLGGRIIRVDHVSEFRAPTTGEKDKYGNKILQEPVDVRKLPKNKELDKSIDDDKNYEKRKRKMERSKKNYREDSESDADIEMKKINQIKQRKRNVETKRRKHSYSP